MEARQSAPVLQIKPSQQSYRILLVEENPYVVQMMLRVLEHMQLPVDHAPTKSSAIRFAGEQEYQLAILDIFLKDDNGFELVKLLRQQQPEMQFITMTTNNPKSVESKVRELRVVYHLVKPFSIAELRTVLKHTINRSREN